MDTKTFCLNDKVKFNEIILKDGIFSKLYEINNPEKEEIFSIPDGTVDIQCLWKNGEISTHICGSLTHGGISRIGEYERCVGMRFRIGVIPKELECDIETITDNRISIYEFFKVNDIDRNVSIISPMENIADFFIENIKDSYVIEKHEIVEYLIKEINENKGNLSVAEVINHLGYCHRYTDRVFKSSTGFSIKKFANIIRLQEAVQYLKAGEENEIYESLGYYDQAHFIHEFKRFTSLTPSKFKKILKTIEIC